MLSFNWNLRLYLLVILCICLPDVGLAKKKPSRANFTEVTLLPRSKESLSALVLPIHLITDSIYNRLVKDNAQSNFVFSPLAIHRGVHLLYYGAGRGSKTEEELKGALNYSDTAMVDKIQQAYKCLAENFEEVQESASKDRKKPLMDIWNLAVLNGKTKIKSAYHDMLNKFHYGRIIQLSKHSMEDREKLAATVNEWGEKAGFESELVNVEDLDKDFSFCLHSSIRVEAQWFKNFYSSPEGSLFYNYGRSDEEVSDFESIWRENLPAQYLEFSKGKEESMKVHEDGTLSKKHIELLSNWNFRAIRLQLTGHICFTIIEPLKVGSGDELENLEKKLFSRDSLGGKGNSDALTVLFSALDSHHASRKLEKFGMPAFKFETRGLNLLDAMHTLNVTSIFKKDQCDLSRITKQRIHVSQMQQDAIVGVNENGLGIASVSNDGTHKGITRSTKKKDKIRPVRNPFIFVIRYQRIPLAVGHFVTVE